jgi:hypothetical protein
MKPGIALTVEPMGLCRVPPGVGTGSSRRLVPGPTRPPPEKGGVNGVVPYAADDLLRLLPNAGQRASCAHPAQAGPDRQRRRRRNCRFRRSHQGEIVEPSTGISERVPKYCRIKNSAGARQDPRWLRHIAGVGIQEQVDRRADHRGCGGEDQPHLPGPVLRRGDDHAVG